VAFAQATSADPKHSPSSHGTRLDCPFCMQHRHLPKCGVQWLVRHHSRLIFRSSRPCLTKISNERISAFKEFYKRLTYGDCLAPESNLTKSSQNFRSNLFGIPGDSFSSARWNGTIPKYPDLSNTTDIQSWCKRFVVIGEAHSILFLILMIINDFKVMEHAPSSIDV
jgi:hypothetical protein